MKFFDGISFGNALIAAYGRIVGQHYFYEVLSSVIGMMNRDPDSVEVFTSVSPICILLTTLCVD